MFRLAMSIFGVSAVITAWAIYKGQQKNDPTRRVPAQEAAAQLREAWADYHTQA